MKTNRKIISSLFITLCCAFTSCSNGGSESKRTYLVKFQNYDQFLLYSVNVKSGDSVNYKGPTPTRNSGDDTIFYRWTGWDKELTNIISDTTFTATYYQGNRYKATFINDDLILQDKRFNENVIPTYNGPTPTKESESEDELYVFSGWSPELTPITKDTTYCAQYNVIGKDDMIVINNKDHDEFNANIDMVKNYFELEDNPNTENNEIAQFLTQYGHQGGYNGAKGYEISWKKLGSPSNSYTVEISSKSSLDPVEMRIDTDNDSCYVYNLVPGTYYYRIKDNNSSGRSQIQSFSFTNRLRTIETKGELSNMRDIGGYRTNDNKQIKYGLIYRNAHMGDAGKYIDYLFKDLLKIKTELDVRFPKGDDSPTRYSSSEHPVDGVSFYNYGLTDAYPYMISDNNTIASIKSIFTLLTNGSSLPLSFHCTNGADRTGLLALLIEGALNVCDEDIYRDYELTSFCAKSSYWQPRCDIVSEGSAYKFREDGYRSDTWRNGSFEKVIIDMKKTYSNSTASIAETVYNFLTKKCGVTPTQIQTLRQTLISE